MLSNLSGPYTAVGHQAQGRCQETEPCKAKKRAIGVEQRHGGVPGSRSGTPLAHGGGSVRSRRVSWRCGQPVERCEGLCTQTVSFVQGRGCRRRQQWTWQGSTRLCRKAGKRCGSAAVQGGTRLLWGRRPCRRHRPTCRCSACGVMPSAAAEEPWRRRAVP
jgi:hypothetical protein